MRYYTYFNFFNYIKFYFGLRGIRNLNYFIKINKTITNCILRIRFLKACIKHSLTPVHLKGIQQFKHINLSQNSMRRFDGINKKYIDLLLRLELTDTYQLRSFRAKLFSAYNNIIGFFPVYITKNFFNAHTTQEYRRMHREIKKIDNKIRLLMEKDLIKNRRNIKSITYNTPSNKENFITINISPDEFSTTNSLDIVHEKWFVNMSDVQFPSEVQGLLQLGDRFGLPPFEQLKKMNTINFIKHIENNIQKFKLNEELNINIRSLAVSTIEKLFKNFSLSYSDKILSSMYNSTRTFIKQHPEVLVTRADKGSVTVALDNKKYLTQMEEMLSDNSTYEVVNYDPIKKITIISCWKQKEYIDIHTYRRIYCGDGNLPRAYGLPKIHKPNCENHYLHY